MDADLEEGINPFVIAGNPSVLPSNLLVRLSGRCCSPDRNQHQNGDGHDDDGHQ